MGEGDRSLPSVRCNIVLAGCRSDHWLYRTACLPTDRSWNSLTQPIASPTAPPIASGTWRNTRSLHPCASPIAQGTVRIKPIAFNYECKTPVRSQLTFPVSGGSQPQTECRQLSTSAALRC
ncbi:MAG: hypothetical protein HC769_12995 [Cyanobacteria bacterium CRU_2_1]|nr:hypothetical protein [Cyanobacteria bacterium RU_5_0]NJR59673.1 hypothetical protein [Cyanobacteria bacterium CRU_2_1]